MKFVDDFLKPGLKYRVENEIAIFNETQFLQTNNRKFSSFYNLIAGIYDLGSWIYYWFHGGENQVRKSFLDQLVINPGDNVLEVSIGTGINLQMLPKNASYFGIDISYGMLKQCQKKLRHANIEAVLFQAEAENLPFRDGVFDCVFHVGGINYFNNKQKAITEMIRVAKPGSIITLVDETDTFFETFSWIPFLKKIFPTGTATQPPLDLLPKSMKKVSIDKIVHGNYWRLSFQKP